jgi:hypothetical protein
VHGRVSASKRNHLEEIPVHLKRQTLQSYSLRCPKLCDLVRSARDYDLTTTCSATCTERIQPFPQIIVDFSNYLKNNQQFPVMGIPVCQNGYIFISGCTVTKEGNLREMITDSFIIADMSNKGTLPTTPWTNNREDIKPVKSTTTRWCVQQEVEDQFHLHLATKHTIFHLEMHVVGLTV